MALQTNHVQTIRVQKEHLTTIELSEQISWLIQRSNKLCEVLHGWTKWTRLVNASDLNSVSCSSHITLAVRLEKNRANGGLLPDVILLDIQMPGMTG